MTQLPPLITAPQAARVLCVDPETVRRWARAGKIPSVPWPNGSFRFKREVIDAIANGTPDEVAA